MHEDGDQRWEQELRRLAASHLQETGVAIVEPRALICPGIELTWTNGFLFAPNEHLVGTPEVNGPATTDFDPRDSVCFEFCPFFFP